MVYSYSLFTPCLFNNNKSSHDFCRNENFMIKFFKSKGAIIMKQQI